MYTQLFIYLWFQHANSLKAQKQTKADSFLNKTADKSSAGWHFIQNQSVMMSVESKAKFCSISFEKAGQISEAMKY